MPPRGVGGAAIAIAALVLAGCGPTVPRGRLGPVTEEASREAVLGLCESRATVERNFPAARDVFFDQAHDELHVIAAAVEEVDRQVAARLLEAMSLLETDFIQQLETDRTVADLDGLIEATGAGLRRIGLAASACP